MTDIRQGGCLCGKVRFEVDLTGHETGNCHCTDCQKNTAAPFITFTLVPKNQFRWISAPDGKFMVSERANRWFCSTCGTTMHWEKVEPWDQMDFSTATLDDPSGLPAEYEIYTRSRMTGVMPAKGAKQFEAELQAD